MITGTYLISAALLLVVAFLFNNGGADQPAFSDWGLIAALGVTFFFASAGASSAYLTVSEIFPMEVRALAIAFFYAVGTAIGGITGPQVFERLANTGDPGQVALGYVIGAVVMAIGGITELILGVRAEGQALEDIAKPLTAEDAEKGRGEAEPEAVERGEKEAPAGAVAPAPDERTLERHRNRESRQRAGARRYRPGPGNVSWSPFISQPTPPARPEWTDVEIDRIAAAVERSGEMSLDELARAVDARTWGPGRFRTAVRAALDEGAIRRAGRGRYAPPARSATEG
jgi:hypothetical protein